jgi:hypothetical protein
MICQRGGACFCSVLLFDRFVFSVLLFFVVDVELFMTPWAEEFQAYEATYRPGASTRRPLLVDGPGGGQAVKR